MQLKLFVLPIKNLGAAEAEMNAFLRGHRVLAVKKEFVADGENSFLKESSLLPPARRNKRRFGPAPLWLVRPVANPNGIPSFSPGLRAASYPGKTARRIPQPQRGCIKITRAGHRVRSTDSTPSGLMARSDEYPA